MSADKSEKTDNLEITQKKKTQTNKPKQPKKENTGASNARPKEVMAKQPKKEKTNIDTANSRPKEENKTSKKQGTQQKTKQPL